MKKLSKKSVTLFVGVMAVCAFALPAMASAASWTGTFPSTHVLDSSNPANRVSFSVAAPVNAGSTCAIARFHVVLDSAFDGTVTAATFQNCMGAGGAVNCTVTPVATRLPWTITNPTTTNVTIDGVHIDAFFENTPGAASACAAPGNVTLTGNLAAGSWSNVGRELTFTSGSILSAHFAAPIGTQTAVVSGTVADTQDGTMVD